MTKDTLTLRICSIILLLAVWLMILIYLLFGRRVEESKPERPNYRAAFDLAFLS